MPPGGTEASTWHAARAEEMNCHLEKRMECLNEMIVTSQRASDRGVDHQIPTDSIPHMVNVCAIEGVLQHTSHIFKRLNGGLASMSELKLI